MDNLSGFPSLNFLHTFESVARHLSFTNAAKELFVTQAAVSHQIKALEDYLGVKLFYREKRKVFLTEEGQKLLPSVVSGLQGIADSLENIRNYDSEDTIVVGVGSSFSANWLVHLLGAFYQRYPEVNLHLKISNNDPDNSFKSSFIIFILDNKLLVSAFILLETKSTSPANILSL